MKMNLKKYKNIKINLNIFTKKNYFIFLISLFILSIIIGIIFFCYINTNDKTIISSNIKNYFTIAKDYNYLSTLLDSIKNNIFTVIIIWILGISIIGIFFTIFLYFVEGFTLGFSISSIFFAYKVKGIIGVFSYLFPTKIVYICLLFLLTYYSIKFSYDMINYFFLKKDISLQENMKKYLKMLLLCIIVATICSLLEVFINPLMIKLFSLIN